MDKVEVYRCEECGEELLGNHETSYCKLLGIKATSCMDCIKKRLTEKESK